jgi:hypothetical protein
MIHSRVVLAACAVKAERGKAGQKRQGKRTHKAKHQKKKEIQGKASPIPQNAIKHA